MIERFLLITAALAVATLVWWWWTRRDGKVRVLDSSLQLSSKELGASRGYHATFVQFSTPMCAKCPPTAVLLKRIASEHTHVTHVEVDASERLDLARRFDVMRTPTVLVLDSDGTVVARMSGAPSDHQAREALAAVPSSGTEYSI